MDPDFLENEEKYKAIKKGKLQLCDFINCSDLMTLIITMTISRDIVWV